MDLFFVKLIVTVGIVMGISSIAERVSPRVAGVLAGYPLGSAIVLFFFGFEQSAQFAANSAVYMMAGLLGELIFLYSYYRVSTIATRYTILLSSLAAIISFSAVILLLKLFTFNPYSSIAIYLLGLAFFTYIFRAIPDHVIKERVKLSPLVMFLRAALAAAMIILITWSANMVGSEWAGLFAAFPVTLFPLILIIHSTYGKEPVHTFIKHLPRGLWSLLIYLTGVIFIYPRLGVYAGTAIALGISTVYLILFNFRKKST